jgi:hypothetical protein
VSYCRFWWDDSDVYVYADVSGGITCCACGLAGSSVNVETPAEMLAHLLEHRAAGHTVPEHALEALREEAGLPLECPDRDWLSEQAAWMIAQPDSDGVREYGRMLLDFAAAEPPASPGRDTPEAREAP